MDYVIQASKGNSQLPIFLERTWALLPSKPEDSYCFFKNIPTPKPICIPYFSIFLNFNLSSFFCKKILVTIMKILQNATVSLIFRYSVEQSSYSPHI